GLRDRGGSPPHRRDRRGARKGLRREAGTRHGALVLGRVRADALRDRERQLRHLEWPSRSGARREPRRRRPGEDRAGVRPRGPASLRGCMKSLDAFLPAYEFSTRHAVSVAVDPARADRALREVTFREVPLVRGLLACRPSFQWAHPGGLAPSGEAARGGWVKLVTFDNGRVGELRDNIVVELDVPSMRDYFERAGHVRPTGEEPAIETVKLRAPI